MNAKMASNGSFRAIKNNKPRMELIKRGWRKANHKFYFNTVEEINCFILPANKNNSEKLLKVIRRFLLFLSCRIKQLKRNEGSNLVSKI